MKGLLNIVERIVEKDLCCGCQACYNICPNRAINMIESNDGFFYPEINKEKCIDCGICKKACPIINKLENNNSPTSYAAYTKSDSTRMNSSSGGIFSTLASYILRNNGIVFGASFTDNYMVKHISIKSEDDLKKLRGSKYVQSKIGDTYKECKDYLEANHLVLYTGTPCQINGLYTFLGKEYSNLYTQDIICHGVPSPKAWKKYIEYRKMQDKDNKLLNVNFRSKRKGWRFYEIEFSYEDNLYRNEHKNDIFIKAFLKNLSLRSSCYNCHAKTKQRISDITLGDFWGIDNIDKNYNDDKGVSLVIINSEKGMKLFEKIKNDISYKNTNYEVSIEYNKSLYNSSIKPDNREDFFDLLEEGSYDKLIQIDNLKKTSIKDKIRHLIYIMKKKID